MPNDPMMTLGGEEGYQFGIETAPYDQVRRQRSWRWAQQDVLGERPFQQYVGPGHTEITISGYVTPHFKGGLRQIEYMAALADAGEPRQLVDSLGNVWGDFVITQIAETRRGIGPAGLPLRIEFSLTLVSTNLEQSPQAAAQSAAASASPETEPEPEPEPEGAAMAPGRIFGITADREPSSLVVSWGEPSSNVSSILDYQLQIGIGGAVLHADGRIGGSGRLLTVQGTRYQVSQALLEINEVHPLSFRVRARNAVGYAEQWSPIVQADPRPYREP